MKKLLSIVLVLALSLALFTGCGGAPENEGEADLIPLKVGATLVPHCDILEFVKDKMEDEGYDLQIVEFSDYVMPNTATEDGSLDANFFQHIPYMEEFNEKNGTHLAAVFLVHFEPFGLYPGKVKAIEDLPQGASIAVPNDASNEARALLLLEATGLIKLKEGAGMLATINDIAENPKKLKIVEMEAAQIPNALVDVEMAVINGNYALNAGLNVDRDAVAVEDKESIGAVTYANPIVVKEGNENNPGILALIKSLNSDDVRDYINEKYEGSVVPVF
ncbi:MAG: MetQ/NlpA family ABC transporter substrate-binding protein [Anaerovoracaceae bacterium]|jgi:D-methionine transport system substrate-binding protein